MNVPFFIARRYLFSKRKKNFINIISILSVAAVAFGTAALVIVLSVFNGLEDLLRSINNSFDPQIKIQASSGKSFEANADLIRKIETVPGVEFVTEVIEDYAYVRYQDANQVVIVKGVSDNFIDQNRIPKENLVEGQLLLKNGEISYAIVGRGVQSSLSIAVANPMFPLQVFYIKNVKPTAMDPSSLYAKQNIVPGGVFSIVQNFDENYIIVPLAFMQSLMNYGDRRTSIEVKARSGFEMKEVEQGLQEMLGDGFDVLNHDEQHQDLYKLLRMEKLFTFMSLSLLLIILSVNIFFSLMMLALDKKKDITILSSMGASRSLVRNIFMAEGGLIAGFGTLFGLILGGFLCWIQIRYGIISMGMETSVTQGYPMKVAPSDFVLTLVVVAVITMIISIRPARLASNFVSRNELLGKQ